VELIFPAKSKRKMSSFSEKPQKHSKNSFLASLKIALFLSSHEAVKNEKKLY
jgi:hypothetical protein